MPTYVLLYGISSNPEYNKNAILCDQQNKKK